jgi:hypothetical protein
LVVVLEYFVTTKTSIAQSEYPDEASRPRVSRALFKVDEKNNLKGHAVAAQRRAESLREVSVTAILARGIAARFADGQGGIAHFAANISVDTQGFTSEHRLSCSFEAPSD